MRCHMYFTLSNTVHWQISVWRDGRKTICQHLRISRRTFPTHFGEFEPQWQRLASVPGYHLWIDSLARSQFKQVSWEKWMHHEFFMKNTLKSTLISRSSSLSKALFWINHFSARKNFCIHTFAGITICIRYQVHWENSRTFGRWSLLN